MDRHSPEISPFLLAPEDHRLCLGYLESWNQREVEPRFRGSEPYYMRSSGLLSEEGLKYRLIELQHFIKAATNIDHDHHGRFIIRDTDLEGHNRIYDSRNRNIIEYDEREGEIYNDAHLEKSTILKVPSVKWVMSDEEHDLYPLNSLPAPWRRIW
jgi:hypothetical protein